MELKINELDKNSLEKAESLLFNGNGFIGVRGNLEEDYYDFFNTNRATFINGFYDIKKVCYPEKMYGFTDTCESIVSVPDGQTSIIWIGGEQFSILKGKMIEHTRKLDMEKGKTIREITWQSPAGKVTKISIVRMASYLHPNLFVMKYKFERKNHNLPIMIETHINFFPIKTIDYNDPRVGQQELHVKIDKVDFSNKKLFFSAPKSECKGSLKWSITDEVESILKEDKVVIKSTLTGPCFEKIFSYCTDGDAHIGMESSIKEIEKGQNNYLNEFWQSAKVLIESEYPIENSVNYGTYSLLSSVGKDGWTSISAKGLSGDGYEGHYFWDTEMYLFPSFLHLSPQIAKQLLMFRVNTLPQAKDNRRLMGYQQGALYPWRTISGTESSSFFEAGSAQLHINADVAHSFIEYYRYTRDLLFILKYGFEILIETGRIFLEIGYFKDEVFHIDEVTGPDEYTVLVNDNHYTNKMIQNQFQWICLFSRLISEQYPRDWEKLKGNLHLTRDELDKYERGALKIALPFEKSINIIAQDNTFLNREFWPIPKEKTKYPLLLNYHPLKIYRYQITKQADAVLPLMLYPFDYSNEVTKKTVEYYDKITTHDSSLSYSTYSIVYSRLKDKKKSFEYFMKNSRIDIDNTHGNTKDGIHTASMGGTMMAILYGFCNLHIENEDLVVENNLPNEINKIKFRTFFKGNQYEVEVSQKKTEIKEIK